LKNVANIALLRMYGASHTGSLIDAAFLCRQRRRRPSRRITTTPTSQHRSIAASQHRSIAASQHRSAVYTGNISGTMISKKRIDLSTWARTIFSGLSVDDR
jgi:hypothetical protein